jgi:hypothetical protein
MKSSNRILKFIGILMLIVASIELYALDLQEESSWNIISIFFVTALPFLLYGKYPKEEENK